MHFPDHPSAIVGLSNILLDIYTGELSSPPLIPPLIIPGQSNTALPLSVITSTTSSSLGALSNGTPSRMPSSSIPIILHGPLGLPSIQSSISTTNNQHPGFSLHNSSREATHDPHSHDSTTSLLDRIAARDRAYGLLSELTKLGSGWNYSEAWFALARAYEDGGQPDKAREVLWWCVELEEGRGVRDWGAVCGGGYVL